ncbi:MAG: alanine:cation symporter family protein [Paludibacteraceae bacterium]|nr:alanine:cation symporter family protein [Paludibacteraceae bacterium]MBQ8713991.1 alanine:cation symporter family protein [Prevotella sp.]
MEVLNQINDALWGYLLIGALIGCGLWFTWNTRFVQFRMVGEMLRLLTDASLRPKGSEKHISSFQAFTVSLASRVGTGNLAGVATAIAVGGPGAIFWMWVMALVGSATAFVESTLGQLFKQHHKDSFIGGPAYYIQRGLHCRWMAVLFAILITVSFGLANNSVQSNTICGAMEGAFGWHPLTTGVVLMVMTLVIVFGGIQRIAHVSSVLVPLMAVGYFVLAIVIIVMNIQLLPHVLSVIVKSAFGVEQAIGGTLGAAIMNGVKRGLFSNEAGEGSAPNAAATASVTHPVKQGLIQALGVFTDTLVVCSCTAFIILISGLYTSPELNGIMLTQAALESEVGSLGPVFVAVAIFLFAYSSMIGNYYYGEANVRFMTSSQKVMTLYRLASGGVMVMFGAWTTLEVVWSMIDLCMALLTACNLIAIGLLGKYAFRLLNDYRQQKRQGIKEPTFHRSQLPEIEQDLECWE